MHREGPLIVEKWADAASIHVMGTKVTAPGGSPRMEMSSATLGDGFVGVFEPIGQYVGNFSEACPMPITYPPTGEAVAPQREEYGYRETRDRGGRAK